MIYLLLLLLLLILCYCNHNLTKEPFIDSLNDENYQFSMISYDQDIYGSYNSFICSDDKNWRKGDKSCIDYYIHDLNCNDIGDNGKSANESCKVSCNNCPSSVKIKKERSTLDRINNNNINTDPINDPLDNEFNYTNIYDKIEKIESQLRTLILNNP